MSSQLDFLHDKRKKLHQIDVERSLLKYKFRTSGQRTCYQCGSCFNQIIGGFVQVAPDNLQRCTLNKCQKDITIVQAIVEKSTQSVIICKLKFIIKTADGAAKPSEVVSYSAQGVFFQSVY